MTKNKKVFIAVVSLAVIALAIFAVLFLFHGGADQSEVLIEKNVQR